MQPPSHCTPSALSASAPSLPAFSAPLAAAAASDPLATTLPSPYPQRPRLKRAHASADTHTRTSTADAADTDSRGPAAATAAVAQAPPGQETWSAHVRQRSTSSILDPIKESAAEADSTASGINAPRTARSAEGGGGLGLSFGHDSCQSGPVRGHFHNEDSPPQRKRIRLAPDHEAFARLTLAIPPNTGTSTSFAPLQPALPPTYASPPRPTAQPLPSSGSGIFPVAPIIHPPEPSPYQRGPSSPLAGQTALLPAAPPTSPVLSTALPSINAARPPVDGLATVPWSQTAFFSSPAERAAASNGLQGGNHAGASEADDEVAMLPASGTVELSPHRIYVASLTPSPPSSPRSDDEGSRPFSPRLRRRSSTSMLPSSYPDTPKINPLAVRASAIDALPAALVANLQREHAKAQRGELVLYRPPPSLHALNARTTGEEGESQREARQQRQDSWREFELMREREEAVHDAGDDEDVDAGGKMEEDVGMMEDDVEMEL